MSIYRLSIFAFLLIAVVFASCDAKNPYDTGPPYDLPGNLKKDSLLIAKYLETAEIDSLYRIHDPSGLVIIIQEEGTGSRPNTGNIIYTKYTGSLMSDGSVFDTNVEQVARDNDIYDENSNYGFLTLSLYPLNQPGSFIQGWNIGFRRLRPGSKAKFIIPSPLGYQNSETNAKIPANSILIFDVVFKGMD